MIRNDFVSNSSSCSFVIYSDLDLEKTFKEICRACSVMHKESDWYPNWNKKEIEECALNIYNSNLKKLRNYIPNNTCILLDIWELCEPISLDNSIMSRYVKDGKIIDKEGLLNLYYLVVDDLETDSNGMNEKERNEYLNNEVGNVDYGYMGQVNKDTLVILKFLREHLKNQKPTKESLIQIYTKNYNYQKDCYIKYIECYKRENNLSAVKIYEDSLKKFEQTYKEKVDNVDKYLSSLDEQWDRFVNLIESGKTFLHIHVNTSGDGEDYDRLWAEDSFCNVDPNLIHYFCTEQW